MGAKQSTQRHRGGSAPKTGYRDSIQGSEEVEQSRTSSLGSFVTRMARSPAQRGVPQDARVDAAAAPPATVKLRGAEAAAGDQAGARPGPPEEQVSKYRNP